MFRGGQLRYLDPTVRMFRQYAGRWCIQVAFSPLHLQHKQPPAWKKFLFVQYVHPDCLQTWISEKGSKSCEICQQAYQVICCCLVQHHQVSRTDTSRQPTTNGLVTLGCLPLSCSPASHTSREVCSADTAADARSHCQSRQVNRHHHTAAAACRVTRPT